MRYLFRAAVLVSVLCVPIATYAVDRPTTKIIMLGTGTPLPSPERSGPATAIVVGDRAYLIDFGPGVVRRAAAAAAKGYPAVDPARIKNRVSHASALRSHRRLSGLDAHALDFRQDGTRRLWTARNRRNDGVSAGRVSAGY